jgi:hypothetical protein
VCYFGGCVPLAETVCLWTVDVCYYRWMCSTGSDYVSLDSSCILLGSSCDLLDDIVVAVCY